MHKLLLVFLILNMLAAGIVPKYNIEVKAEENDEEKNTEDKNIEERKTENIQGRDSKMTFNNYQGTVSHEKSNPSRGEGGISDVMFSFNGNGARGPITNISDPNELFEKKRDS